MAGRQERLNNGEGRPGRSVKDRRGGPLCGDRRQLIALIKSVYRHRRELQETGKHLRVSDAALMKEAETLLYGEFALVLNIPPDEVLPLICRQLEEE